MCLNSGRDRECCIDYFDVVLTEFGILYGISAVNLHRPPSISDAGVALWAPATRYGGVLEGVSGGREEGS